MAFSDGQLIFAALFFVAFVVLVGRSYRIDSKKNKELFKGWWKVVLAIVAVLFMFYLVVRNLH